MIDQNNPVAVSAMKKTAADIGDLMITNSWHVSIIESLQAEKQELLQRIEAFQTQVADMGTRNRNLMDELDTVRGNLVRYPEDSGAGIISE